MSDVLVPLLVFFIVVTILVTFITLLGHGLWVVFAAILRALFGIGSDPEVDGLRCPACRHPTSLVKGTCSNCGYRTLALRRSELQKTLRLLRQLHEDGEMGDEVFGGVVQALKREADKLDSTAGLDMRYHGMIQPSAPSAAPGQPVSPFAQPASPAPETAPPADARHETPAEQPITSDAAAAAPIEIRDDEVLDAEIIYPDPVSQPPPPSAAPTATAPHPLDAPEPEPVSAASAAPAFSPRRTIANMLQGFMEEKNIRWGELASGLLIVGSAIGLVISLNQQLNDLARREPYVPALLLMLGTIAIHAAGLYTLRRWRLRTTSRGALIIATLLVPLCFAAGMLFPRTSGTPLPALFSLHYLLAVLVGLVGYGIATSLSARGLFAEGWWRLTTAVMGTVAGQLIIFRALYGNQDAGGHTLTEPLVATTLFALPLASFLVATVAQLRVISRKQHLTPVRGAQTFTVLGIAAFSLAVALALQAGVLTWSSSEEGRIAVATVRALSASLTIAAAVVLSIGVAVHRRCESRRMGDTRMVGTALAILGGMLMFGTALTAWPDPILLIAVSVVSAAILGALAVVGRLPVLHAGAVATASLALLLLFHLAKGEFAGDETLRGVDLIQVMVMGRSSLVLMVPALLSAAAGVFLYKGRFQREGFVYLAGAGGIAAVSTAIALYAGFISGTDANWTTIIFATYAITALIIVPIIRHSVASWVGAGAALLAIVHLLRFNSLLEGPWGSWEVTAGGRLLFAILAFSLLISVYALVLHLRLRASGQQVEPAGAYWPPNWLNLLPLAGTCSAAFAVPFVLYVTAGELGVHAGYAACVAAVWGIAAYMLWEPRLVTAAHAAATVAVGFATAAIACSIDAWQGLGDLRHWQLQLSVLALWCLFSAVVRLTMSGRPQVRAMFRPPWPSVDQLVLGAVILGILGVGFALCLPGISVELGYQSAEVSGSLAVWQNATAGPGCWMALACILCALLIALYERVTPVRIGWLVSATAAPILLVSVYFTESNSVATAVRWSAAVFALIWTTAIVWRRPIQQAIAGVMPSARRVEANVARTARDVAVYVGEVPVLLLTTLALLRVAAGVTLSGPTEGGLFGRLSAEALYVTPLAILVVALLITAVREGSTTFAFFSSLTLQYLVVLAVMLEPLSTRTGWTIDVHGSLLQWLACSLSAFALAWLLLSRWIDRREASDHNVLFLIQLVAALTATFILAISALGPIFVDPVTPGEMAQLLGTWPSYLAAVMASFVACWYFRHERKSLATLGVVIPAVFITLAAASTARVGAWFAYHVATCGFLCIALAAAAVSWYQRRRNEHQWLTCLRRGATTLAVVVFVFLARGSAADPDATMWTITISCGLFAYFATLAIVRGKQIYGYATAIVGAFATTVVWADLPAPQHVAHLIFFHVLTASGIGIFWMLVEIGHQSRHGSPLARPSVVAPVHIFLAIISTACMLLFTGGGAAISILTEPARPNPQLYLADVWGLAALGALALLLIAIVWEQRIGLSLLASYLYGYVVIAMGLNLLQHSEALGIGETSNRWLLVIAGLSIAAYIALTGHLWKWGVNLARGAARLQVPDPVAKLEYISRWLPSFNVIATLVITGLGFIIVFAVQRREMRVAMAFAPLLLAYGISCLAQQYRRFTMQCMTLFLVVVGVVFIGWADITDARWKQIHVLESDMRLLAMVLAYAARLLIVLAGMTLLYSMGVARWIRSSSDWIEPVRRTGAFLAVGTVVTLATVLVLETMWLVSTGTGAPIGLLEVVVISVMLFGFLAALLMMAIRPERDPLSLSEKGRQGYVYAAQAMAALLFAHIYLARPDLFQFGILDYWPYIVMLIAFASVAFAEFCQRKDWTVIAEPMHRTGGFLPLLPALTAWAFFHAGEDAFVHPKTTLDFAEAQNAYALALFFAGLIYVFMSISRRSFLAGMAAAVMGNGALWAWLHGSGTWSLTETPQLWLIPPALSVLGASYINRDRLSSNTLTTIRYICVMIIYLSSTGEMFMKLMEAGDNATIESWLRPLILTCLSVAGIFAGIMFRVRAFLYLGTSFLLMSVVGMVANARLAAGHVWPWWAFGISMGVFILVLFGLFEKHRHEVEELITRLRQWEP